jgi:predicted dehydrogenase
MPKKPVQDTPVQGDEAASRTHVPAPRLPYQPRDPKRYRPNIGLIACGGITKHHLTAYRKAGYRVVALCDLILDRARTRRKEFYPEAAVYEDYRELLKRDDVEVVDIATHPPERVKIIEDAIRAGKHVLSQKPFVVDLDVGARLVDLADRKGVRLAVNQNGRWAPHFRYVREAIAAGLLGEISAAHFAVHWDHSWVRGTQFEKVKHLILYDFAIHWFDMACWYLGPETVRRVYAASTRSATQSVRPGLLGQALLECDGSQASLVFDGHTQFGIQDQTYVTGSLGTIESRGTGTRDQKVTLSTAAGQARPRLAGSWFSDGFHGTMGELLLSIEEIREPLHNARENLKSLAVCFAAVASAERHEPVVPGTVRKMAK